eukprot:359456-Pleurochrysis_carterae.AAC.1
MQTFEGARRVGARITYARQHVQAYAQAHTPARPHSHASPLAPALSFCARSRDHWRFWRRQVQPALSLHAQ